MSFYKGKKPFECNICESRFTQKGHLNTHISSVHANIKPFECDTCKSKFALLNRSENSLGELQFSHIPKPLSAAIFEFINII